ncbi:MAG: endonuclease/exonuclease/phosphatase family protein [Planctomycetota bacterium]
MPPRSRAPSFRILTWNIHKAIGMDRSFDPQRVAEVIRHHQPDVVLLQEVDRGVPRSRRTDLAAVLADLGGFPFHCYAQNVVLKEGGYGNAILSRFRIRRKRNLDLTIAWKKRRGCLHAKLALPGSRRALSVFNWHLGLSAAERKMQVQRFLHTGTWKSLRARDLVILGGDTNDWRNLLYLGADLKEAGFHAWSEGGRRSHLPTYPSFGPVGALDKFFWRGPFHDFHVHRSRLALARTASDHIPLLAEVLLRA